MANDKKMLAVDLARAIGILLVVGGHIGLCWPIEKAIYSFHMPLYFLISGILYKTKPLKNVITTKMQNLLFPYLITAFICWILFGDFSLKNAGSIKQFFQAIIFADREQGLSFNSPLWFLPCLWSVFLINALFEKFLIHRISRLIILFCLGIISTFLISRYDLKLPFRLQTAFCCLPFFICGLIAGPYIKTKTSVGDVLSIKENKTNHLLRIDPILTGAVIFALIWVIISFIDRNGYYVIAHDRYQPLPWFYLRGIFGAMSVLCFSVWCVEWLKRTHRLSLIAEKGIVGISKWSFGIYLFHKPIIIWLRESIFTTYFTPNGEITLLFLFVAGLVFPVVFLLILKKISPIVFSLTMGGR